MNRRWLMRLALLVAALLAGVAHGEAVRLRDAPPRPSPDERLQRLREGMALLQVRALFPDLAEDVELAAYSCYTAVFIRVKGSSAPRLLNVLWRGDLNRHVIDAARVNAFKVQVGMSLAEIDGLLGEPTLASSIGSGAQATVIRSYGPWKLYFENDRLVRISGRPNLDVLDADEEARRKTAAGELKVGEVTADDLLKTEAAPLRKGVIYTAEGKQFLFWEGRLAAWNRNIRGRISRVLAPDGMITVRHCLVREAVKVKDPTEALFAESSFEQRNVIREAKLAMGLTMGMVRCALGPPHNVVGRPDRDGRVVQEQWFYGERNSTRLTFRSGILRDWK